VQGVVDSEDLPLNVSRETIQAPVDGAPGKGVTNQVLKELENLAKNDAKNTGFWQQFGEYLKQASPASGGRHRKAASFAAASRPAEPEAGPR